MQRAFEKIRKKLETQIAINSQECKDREDLLCHDRNFGVRQAIEIVNQVASEYGEEVNENDLTIVESLPSLYPLKDFEEEAVRRVVMSRNGGGWIPCSERLPEESGEYTVTLERYDMKDRNKLLATEVAHEVEFDQRASYWKRAPHLKVIAWRENIEPYQPKGE